MAQFEAKASDRSAIDNRIKEEGNYYYCQGA